MPALVVYVSGAQGVPIKRDLSSAGRASALQAEGHRFEPYRSHSKESRASESDFVRCALLVQTGSSHFVGPSYQHMARWLNWLERPVHTREVESSSLSLAIEFTTPYSYGVFVFCAI